MATLQELVFLAKLLHIFAYNELSQYICFYFWGNLSLQLNHLSSTVIGVIYTNLYIVCKEKIKI